MSRGDRGTTRTQADSDPGIDCEPVVVGVDFSHPGFLDFGEDCDVIVITKGGTTQEFKGRKAGTQLPVVCTRVTASSTTDLVVIF